MEITYFAPRSRVRPPNAFAIGRRGYRLGYGRVVNAASPNTDAQQRALRSRQWENAEPILLPGVAKSAVKNQRDNIRRARQLYKHTLTHGDCAALLERTPYRERLKNFCLLSAFAHENDRQEIITLEFDALRRGKIAAENLWCKASWLSLASGDASLRFRFSFGVVHFEDVADDYPRQRFAAQLTEAMFPESEIISRNLELQRKLFQITGHRKLDFVERIVYFNAPNGGAEFHQDVERGHLGVIYVQVTGRTFWLTLSKSALVDALKQFRKESSALPFETRGLKKLLDNHDRNDKLLTFLNRSPEWARFLIARGHGYLLSPGDALLLPQHDVDNCAWHSVFCPDDKIGEGLSFAVRSIPKAVT